MDNGRLVFGEPSRGSSGPRGIIDGRSRGTQGGGGVPSRGAQNRAFMVSFEREGARDTVPIQFAVGSLRENFTGGPLRLDRQANNPPHPLAIHDISIIRSMPSDDKPHC